jgi:hypothetical protein
MGDKRIARSINQRWDIWRIMTGHQWKTAWRSGKAAKAILKIAELSEPLLRLLLGSDAVFLARGAAEQRMAEDEKWKELSLSIDFEGIPSVEERLGFLLKS